MATQKNSRRLRIKQSIRKRIAGTADRPRLTVFRSNRFIYAQVIDDIKGVTLVSASSVELSKDKNATVAISHEVGKRIAEKALQNGVKNVVFDRNGYLYHGQVKALADGAREGGLQF